MNVMKGEARDHFGLVVDGLEQGRIRLAVLDADAEFLPDGGVPRGSVSTGHAEPDLRRIQVSTYEQI